MSTIKCLSVFLLAILFCNVANAEIPDSTKYTVTFKYNDEKNWCLGGIIGEDLVLTSGGCFSYNGIFHNFTSLKAVIGSNELDVEKVILFEFSKNEKSQGEKDKNINIPVGGVHDFALVKLKQKFNLEKNGLIALSLANNDDNVDEETVVYASDEENNKAEQVNITANADCSDSKLKDQGIYFYDESQLCVKLTNKDDSCHQVGSPLVDESNKLIGVNLDCYDELPEESSLENDEEVPEESSLENDEKVPAGPSLEIVAKVSYFNDLIKEASKANLDKDGKFGSFLVKHY